MKQDFLKVHQLNVRKAFGIGAMAFALAFLPACSDDDLPDKGENNPIPDTGIAAEALNISVKQNPSLATTYRNSSRLNSPSIDGTMPKAPTAKEIEAMYHLPSNFDGTNIVINVPEAIKEDEFVVPTTNPLVYVSAGEYKSLPSKLTLVYSQPQYIWNQDPDKIISNWEKTVNVEVQAYYIDSSVKFGGIGDENSPMQYHVLKGGTLSSGQNIAKATTVYIYNGGTISQAGNEGQITIKGTLISESDINQDADITLQGDFYTTGKIKGKTIYLIGGNMYAGCAVEATDKLYITGTNSHLSAGYIAAPHIELAGGDNNEKLAITLRDKGYLWANGQNGKLLLKNFNNIEISAEEGGKAMVETSELEVNGWDLTDTFGNVAVRYSKRTGTQEREPQFNENCPVDDGKKNDIKYEIKEGDKCAPYEVIDPNEEEPVGPSVENVGSISGPNHDHKISATCIYVHENNDAYISWHTQGDNFHGCIEHATVKDNIVALQAYLETDVTTNEHGAVDFNHVIFDNGKIFVAGDHPKKGGIIGWIDCSYGTFPTNNEAKLNIRQLFSYGYPTGEKDNDGKDVIKYSNGGSGNCIIRNGQYYQIASVAGFETFKVDDFNSTEKFKPVAKLDSWKFNPSATEPSTPWNRDGKNTGKHIATDGNNVVMLTLINRDNTLNTATAAIRVYAASDVNYDQPIASYTIDNAVLSPVDGKDVIAIEGNDIWVCLGNGGVKHLTMNGNSMTEKAYFHLAGKSKEELKALGLTEKEAKAACANGLAVDDKYVYVAHGGAGIVILDKNDLSFITRSKNHAASANYIALANDYIYVAYGLSKVQVYRLNEK